MCCWELSANENGRKAFYAHPGRRDSHMPLVIGRVVEVLPSLTDCSGHGKILTNPPWYMNAIKNLPRLPPEDRVFSVSKDLFLKETDFWYRSTSRVNWRWSQCIRLKSPEIWCWMYGLVVLQLLSQACSWLSPIRSSAMRRTPSAFNLLLRCLWKLLPSSFLAGSWI